jgi:hypothetical protein
MSKLSIAVLAAVAIALIVTARAFVATLDTEQARTSARTTVNPTVMMERAPRNLPSERYDAH